ncbi:hypothetical protein V6N13_069830 [Hibiscus sabdariffa]
MGDGRNGQSKEAINWKVLFAATGEQSLHYFPLVSHDGEVRVKPPAKVFEDGAQSWMNSLVMQFIGDNLFMMQFASVESRDWVLTNGPWHFQNKPTILRKWQPNLQSLEFNMDMIPVWVHLRSIPLELFNNSGLSYIASAIGVPFYMDSITANRSRLEYAKVCVKVHASHKIPRAIPVELHDGFLVSIGVDIPWMPARCFFCKVFGHNDKNCQRKASLIACARVGS